MAQLFDELKEIRKIWGGFRAARVLLTANNLGVFEKLKAQKTSASVAASLKLDKRATEILLDALTGMGLLVKQKGKYINSPLAGKFMVKGAPYYQGDILRHAEVLWKNWSGLDEVVRTGEPNRVGRDHEAFILGMHNIAVFKAKAVIDQIGMKGAKTALDVGGGPGTYSIEMARRGASVTLFDFPATIEIAKKVIKKSGAKGIKFIEGDFLHSDIGSGYDLVFISQIFHAYSEAESVSLLKKAKAALNPKGRVAIQEFVISEDRTKPLEGALFSVNMLVGTPNGRCYSPKEIKGWLKRAGFKGVKEKTLAETVLITASA